MVNNIDINADYKETGAYDALSKDFPLKETRDKCITAEEIEEFKSMCNKGSSLTRKHFENTIKENIEIFNKILQLLTDINKNIKIYLVLVPVHEVRINMYDKSKQNFYNIISEFRTKYNFKFWDFYKYKEISSKNYYFYDTNHLNYDGATVFTKMLNSYISTDKNSNEDIAKEIIANN